MGVQGLQEYIEKHCPSAVVPVELQKLARGSIVGGGQQRPPHSPLRLLVDAENCLHRLYGGFYTDWVSGGQWNHMLGYLAALSKACFHGNIELLVCFNGALEKGRLHEWVKRQVNERQTAQQIISHVQNKGTPPPKVWFLPPVCMAHCIWLALLRFRVGVIQSVEDHHLEVIAMCREGGFHGLVAYDSDYALCNIPCYFSAHALKLSRNGKSLTTCQYLMHEVARQLDLNPNRFVIFASLLGNHILPDEDLAAFHWSLLGPEHPLASLKVRAHQLVLPPCDVVIKAVADYVRNIPDVGDLDAVGKDVFKHSQTCTDDKVLRFKKAVGYYSVASSPAHLPPQLVRPKPTGAPAARPFPKMLDIPHEPLPVKPAGVQHSYPAADPAGKDPPQRDSFAGVPREGKHTSLYERAAPVDPRDHGEAAAFNASSSGNPDSSGKTANHVSDLKGGWEKNGCAPHSENRPTGDPGERTKADLCVTPAAIPGSRAQGLSGLRAQIPSLLSMPTRNHMDVTIPALPAVAPEVLRVAEHRHQKGLMYPYIYHTLTKGEIKLSVTIEDEANKDLPSAVQLFRPIRQCIYGVLFSLAEARKKAERVAMRKNCLPEYAHVIVKEWAAYKGKSPHTPELVEALSFREWTCPNLKKLWLGKAVEDKNRRMRAFLACMRSDTPAMLNPAYVPTPLLVLCCVLRFMLHWPGIDNLDPRGVQLAALFMSGVDMALFANDACGQPVPWEHCCPWMYFDGKLLQSKLGSATREKAQLIDLCDGQAELAAKVEKMRQSILEGLNFTRPPPFLPSPPHGMPFYPPPPMMPPQRRGTVVPGHDGISSQGGKLEIAGTVVGQWAGTRRPRGRGGFPVQVVSVGGPNRGRPRGVVSTPVIRTFGRGGRYHTRVFRSQLAYLSKPAPKPAHTPVNKPAPTADHDAAKETEKPGREERKTSPAPCGGSTTENGVEDDGEPDRLNGEEEEHGALIQPDSAFSNDYKTSDSNPHLNALNEDGGRCGEEGLEAAVLNTEE
ncbi:constitutive coactivator of PPAR-gamma-like protein 1 homolog isoform X2 [Pseudoliparis swirei]|uniref:constitutive coactivator of PPAR-gamma-like protein 1 homolog isoform X2 n=1 Tax=Pseudoliparis swirei TaxID=2059687 RepID=UPI0024BEB0AF|nr:constitutive coactivator of PPAR-gamma-like protein 1 homolog isoform X2 [Pseudoliparis swirei]